MTNDGGRHTDAELVQRLQLRAQHGAAEAAALLNISVRTLRQNIADAKARGLTAQTVIVDEAAKLRTKVKMLTAELAHIARDNITAAEVRSSIYGLAELTPDPPKWLAEATAPKSSGVPIAVWSDWHWGEVVRANETGGVNSFNRKIAKDRLRNLLNSTIDLTMNHMTHPDYPGIVLCLGGDMINGDIHEELQITNDGTVQQSLLEVQEQLIAAITVLAETFPHVHIPCVVGNHGRMTHKPRMKNRVFTSFEWNLYCQLERHFRDNPKVTFQIPEDADAHFKVFNHRFMLTHGDALGVKGGDGIIGSLGPIARGTLKVGRSEAQVGRDFDTLIIGHWHTYIPRGEAVPVIVNGALKGYDEFARLALRARYSRPSQALFFVHPKYGITAQWQVYLDEPRKATKPKNWLTF